MTRRGTGDNRYNTITVIFLGLTVFVCLCSILLFLRIVAPPEPLRPAAPTQPQLQVLPSDTPSATPTETPTPSRTPTPTATETATATPTATATVTPTSAPPEAPTQESTATPTG